MRHAHPQHRQTIIMRAPNPDSMFKPRQQKPTQHSDHPKTTKNRENETAKRGIDIAIARADTAFRVAKSRGLAKLHTSPDWIQMDSAGQQRADRRLLRRLEAERDKKKTVIENEYRYRVEAGILEPVEDLMDGVESTGEGNVVGDAPDARSAKKARLMREEVYMQDDGDSDWSDCEESWDLIGEEMIDINIKYERRRRIRLMTLSKNAERMERDYRSYKAKRDAERMHVGAEQH
jgi:hypothetical protein